MNQPRKFFRERLLRDAGLGVRFHLGLKRRNLIERLHREDLEVANDIGVGRPEEVLIPVEHWRHLAVHEKRVALALAELLARRVEKKRERETIGRLAAHLADEVCPSRDVAPLIRAADFHLAAVVVVEVQEVVALKNLIAELGEREGALARLEALLDRLLREHLRHAEVDRYVAQKLDCARALVPVVVVDHDGCVGAVEVEYPRKVLSYALLVLLDLLYREHVSLGGLAARVANEPRRAADKRDHLVAGELETAEDDDGNEVSCLQGAGRRVKTAIDSHGLLEGLLDFRVGHGLHESACPKFVKQFHFSSLSMAVLAGLEPTTRCLEGSCSVQMSYRT